MRILLLIFITLQFCSFAQDKVFMKNGKRLNGIVVSVANEVVYFKLSDTSKIEKIKKEDILLIDAARGTRYIFGSDRSAEATATAPKVKYKKNSIGMQPADLLFGRATFVYERLSKNGKVGCAFPVSLAFFPPWFIFEEDPSGTFEKVEGLKIISGIDLNFYLTDNEHSRFFIGPRIRFGTDPFISSALGFQVQGYTIQTQIGWRFGQTDRQLSQHLSLGFGIGKILDIPAGLRVHPEQVFGWYSLNYRVGINW